MFSALTQQSYLVPEADDREQTAYCQLHFKAAETQDHTPYLCSPIILHTTTLVAKVGHRHSVKNATWGVQAAQCAFKDLMIHEVLHFALHIAFRRVLHRCGSQDIRC